MSWTHVDEIKKLRAERATLKRQLTAARTEVKRLREEREELRDQLGEATGSTS